jgi:predicted nucleic acid-binding protein
MHRTIISDTSCLILLDKIGELSILNKLFGNIITTSEVAEEFGQPLPRWFEIKEPNDKNYQAIIEASVDKGEASAIAVVSSPFLVHFKSRIFSCFKQSYWA